MLAQDTARGLPLDFILRQQAQPRTRTDRQTPQPPTLPGEHRGGNHLAKNHWLWWQWPWRSKSKASGRALDGRAQSTALPHHSKIHRHMHLYLYPYVHLNSAYSTDKIAYIYTFFFCLILTLTVTMHATLSSGRRVSISPHIKKNIYSIKCTNPKQKKS